MLSTTVLDAETHRPTFRFRDPRHPVSRPSDASRAADFHPHNDPDSAGVPMTALFRRACCPHVGAATKADLDPQRVPISTMRCLIPYATAAVRESTPSLVKMLDTWRWTVRSLRCSSLATARFALPRAMR